MPTTVIDGEVFDVTDPGGTPYVKSTNKPRAMWIWSKAFAGFLDSLKAYVADQLTATNAAVTALDAKVASSGQVLGRRWTIGASPGTVTTNIGSINGSTHYRAGGWIPDTLLGDDGDWVSANDLKGGALIDSTGIMTIKRAGVWQLTFNWNNDTGSRPRFGVRKNGNVVWIGTSVYDSTDPGAQSLSFISRCAVNDTFDIVSTGGIESLYGIQQTGGQPVGTSAIAYVNTNRRRPMLQLVRLSA